MPISVYGERGIPTWNHLFYALARQVIRNTQFYTLFLVVKNMKIVCLREFHNLYPILNVFVIMMMVMAVTSMMCSKCADNTDLLSQIEFKHTNHFRLMIPLFDMIQTVLKSVPAIFTMQIPVVVWPKMWVCGYFIAGITSLNPAEGMNVRLLCFVYVVQIVASAMSCACNCIHDKQWYIN